MSVISIKQFKNVKTVYKWLFSYIIVISVIIVTLAFIIYTRTSFIIDEQAVELYRNKAEKDSMAIDGKLNQIRELGVKFSSTPWTLKAMGANRDLREVFDIITLSEISQEINYYKTMNSEIFDLFLVFPYSSNVISDYGRDSVGDFFNGRDRFEENVYKSIVSETEHFNYFKLMKPVEVSLYSNKYRVIPIIQSLQYNPGIPRGTLLVLLKENSIYKIVEERKIKNSKSFILYNDGTILGEVYNKKLQESKYFKKILDNRNEIQVMKAETDFYYVVPSALAPWKYVYAYPKSMMMGKARDNGTYIMISSILIFIMGFLLSAFFTVKSYNPLLKIFKAFMNIYPASAGKDGGKSEFQVIENSMDLMFKEKNEMTKKLSIYEPVIRTNTLLQLVKGNFNTEDEGRKLLREVGLDDSNYCFYTVIMIESRDTGSSAAGEKSISMNYLKKIPVIDIVENTIHADDLKCQVFETDTRRITAIVCLQSDDSNAYAAIKRIVSNIRTSVRETLNEEIFTGEGGIFDRTLGISKSFKKAEKMLDWIIFTGNDSEENIEKFLVSNSSYYFYPVEWEERIINNLKKGDLAAVESIIKELKYENCVRRTLRFGVFKRLFIEIIETEMKVIDELNLYNIIDEDEYDKLISYGRESELWLYIGKICRSICKSVCSLRENANTEFNVKLIEFVRSNYHDSNISLKDLADRFNLSVSTVSAIFKELAGYNFLDFVNRKRIEKAKELLRTTDEEVQVISARVGYQCDKSFRRSFKKYEGISPLEYRTMKKNA